MNSTTIILVDDDLTINYFHKILLKTFFDQEHIKTCFNGKQAIATLLSLNDKLDKKDTVIVLLDLNMPVMNGWEFLAEFHIFKATLKFNCTIYIITSSINPEDKKIGISDYNVENFLQKPLSKNDVDLILNNKSAY
jgi:CheY-like chemotaxis protein